MKNITELLNESMNPNPNNYPSIVELGEGQFEGAMWGNCFLYEGNKYFCENGVLGIYPCYCKATINENNVSIEPTDNYQRPELVEQFKD